MCVRVVSGRSVCVRRSFLSDPFLPPPRCRVCSVAHVRINSVFHAKARGKSLDQMSSSFEQMRANVGKLLRGIDRYGPTGLTVA